jgi:hypothetical protein
MLRITWRTMASTRFESGFVVSAIVCLFPFGCPDLGQARPKLVVNFDKIGPAQMRKPIAEAALGREHARPDKPVLGADLLNDV